MDDILKLLLNIGFIFDSHNHYYMNDNYYISIGDITYEIYLYTQEKDFINVYKNEYSFNRGFRTKELSELKKFLNTEFVYILRKKKIDKLLNK